MGFCYVGKSEVGCFHRPSPHQIRHMRDIQKVSLIVTVQQDSEQPKDVAASCKQFGLKHIHIPLEGANKPLLENKVI